MDALLVKRKKSRSSDYYHNVKLAGPISEAMHLNQKNYKNFTLRILPETLFSIPIAMYFPKNHFLANEVNSKISILHSAGLIDHWVSMYLTESPKETFSSGPRQLSVAQLMGGIYIYFGGLLLGFLTFLVELSSTQNNNILRKCTNFLN